jgi:2-oxo-4-hydroxy-4-carboxy-5-ureidoimidazoline decarboxylase
MGTDQLTWFNQLPARAARQTLLECCSAPGWPEQMTAGRPYCCADDAIKRSSAIVAALSAEDLSEALAGHPRIGEAPDTSQDRADRDGARSADWSRREQAGVDADDTQIRQALAEANLEYEQRFGHIYLVCASGRTGKELLALLRGRLQNEPEDEWQVVRTELKKINALRLRQLLDGVP